MSKEFYGFDDDDFNVEDSSMKPWHPITWPNDRPDFLAWRYVDETETGIEVLAYNYAYGKNLEAFYLENAASLQVIRGSRKEEGDLDYHTHNDPQSKAVWNSLKPRTQPKQG